MYETAPSGTPGRSKYLAY